MKDADTEPKTRQEKKSKGTFNRNDKEKYNSKHVRSYEKRMEAKTVSI